VGTTHQYGEDHTSCGPGHNISLNCDSLLDHYLMTGDPSSLEATSRLAEQILKCSPWSRSARAVGWPLAQAVRWYEQSGDERFLRKAEAFVQAAKAYVEARRGVFAEVHGCWNYRGNVPFMVGYLAFGLIRYHQLTKDPEVLRLLVGLVEGIFAECRARWGRFIYSPFPENNLPAGCHRAWNGLIGGLAGYVACTTGDDRCRAWAQECYDAIVEKEKDLQVSMDMLQIGGWLLHAVAGWGTRTSG
jgi:hypothetical protein